MYISFGIFKRMKINLANIEEVIDDPELLSKKLSKDTIDFIARDFEVASPHFVLKLKQPTKATLLFGIEKEFQFVAVRVDNPNRFKEVIS